MIRTSLVVLALGWSSVVAAQPDPGGAPAPMEEVQPAPPPEGSAATVMAPPPPEVEAPRKKKKLSLMWAPLRLVVPLIEFTGEYRVMDKLGVSLQLGYGKRTVESSTAEASGTEFEGGVQIRYYAIGSFEHGMEVGVEALEEYVAFEEPLPAGIVGVAAGGLTVGPFLGYKIATGIGFTFEAQLGARYLVVEPKMYGTTGGSFDDQSKWLPLLHLNIGWSF